MKTGKTLAEFSQEILRQNEAKRDYLVSTENLRMQVQTGDTVTLNMHDTRADGEHIAMLDMNDITHSQIGTYLGIGAKYYDKMHTEYPGLLAENVNAWFHKDPQNRMIRTIDGRAKTGGVIMCEHVKSLDINTRKAEFVEQLPYDLLERALKYISTFFF
jgi:hypothetical protein